MDGSVFALSLLPLVSPDPDPGFVVTGMVLDPTGAPVAVAVVSAAPDAGGEGASVKTGADGRFVLKLDPGGYTVKVSAPGFAEGSHRIVAAGQGSTSLDFALSLSKLRETVSVESTGDYSVGASPARPAPRHRSATCRNPSP